MLTQTFDLADENWRFRRRIRFRNLLLVPTLLAALALGTSTYVAVTVPFFLLVTLEVWGIGGVLLVPILILGNQGDPVRMTLTGTDVTFERASGRKSIVRLDRRRVRIVLTNQSAYRGVTSGPFANHILFFGDFAQNVGVIPLTSAAYDSLRRQLPRAGVALVKTGPVPLQGGGLQEIFVKRSQTRTESSGRRDEPGDFGESLAA
jgi:hypothetical protein